MPAKIPKPSIPSNTDSHKNGFFHFGKQKTKNNQESLQTDKTQNALFSERNTSNDVQKHLKDYLLAVNKTGCSSSTVRNYKSDINQFLDFADSKDLDDLRNKPKLLAFAHYQRDKGLKENSIKRKLVSITQFKIWLKQQGLISSEIPLRSPIESEKTDLKARKIINQGREEETKKIETPDTKNQKKSKAPQSRIFLLLNLLALFLFLGGLAFFAYQQFGQAIISLAYPSTPTAPNRILSYQGRLTNIAQSPISEPTAMTYTLYDDVTEGNILWSSNTCTIDPDQDGIFNANLGAGAGTGADNENCGNTIGEDVFTLYNNVWLEVAVGAEILTPRQPIRTVAYALNSATLQGLPPAEVATNSTILMMNSNGELVLGMENPTIKTATDSSGLTIESKQIVIQTTAGSDGDIILAPDGDGEVQISSADLVLSNGTIYSNSYAPVSNSTDISFVLPASGQSLNFRDNTNTSTLLTITGDGQMGIGVAAPNHALDIFGNIGLSTAAYINWGATDGETGYGIRESEGTIQYKNSGGSWADLGSGGGSGDSYWELDGGILYPNNSTLDLLIGSNASASAKFAFTNSGTPTLSMANYASAFNLKDSTVNALNIENGLLSFDTSNSRIGIGTTSPGALLSLAAATVNHAQLNLASSASTNPSAPNNGDLWWNGSSLNFYDGTATTDILAGASLWVDGGTYIYPSGSKTLGNATSGGSNKLNGLYMADSGSIYFGRDNDINFTFADSTLSVTQGNNDISFDSDTFFIDGSANKIGIGTNSPTDRLTIAGGNISHYASGNPTLKGTYNTAGSAMGVDVVGRYAYVADSGSGLQIIDISNPSAPALAGTYNTSGYAQDVSVAGKYAYVADLGAGLQIIDISNPKAPSLVATYVTSDDALGVVVAGKYAYVAADGAGLIVVDISDPTAPSLAGSYDTSGVAHGVFISGRYAYVADGASGLQIIDVIDPTTPSLVGNHDDAGSAYDVYVSGKYAYVADYALGLKIINVVDPTSPSLLGTYNTPGGASGLYWSHNYAYVADSGSGVTIINTSNPSLPILVGSYDTAGNAQDVFVAGKYAYVADYTEGLQVLDINGLETPAANIGSLLTNNATITENLNVANNTYIGNSLNVGNGGILSNGPLSINYGSTSPSLLKLLNVGNDYLNVLNNGNVGIGSSSPDRKLEIVDDTNPQLRLSQTEGSVYADLHMNSNGDLVMNVDGINNQLVLDNGGNVGIGRANPDEKLTVDGSVNAEKYYDLTNKDFFLDPASATTALRTAGDARIGGDVYVEGGEIFFTPLTTSDSTTEGTLYYDDDVDHLYLSDGAGNWHRVALDMTKYAASGTIFNQEFIEIAHNQGTEDISFTAWVKDKLTGLWEKITDFSSSIVHDLNNEFNPSFTQKTKTESIALDDSEYLYGTGADGDITLATDTNINTTASITGRTCADAINYNVTALTANTATLNTAVSGDCLVAGDEILLINLQGTSTASMNTGNYETLRVQSVSGTTVTFTTNKSKFYGDTAAGDANLSTTIGSGQIVMLQRVPNYNDVTIGAAATFSPDAYTTKGGVMAFRARGTVTIEGAISASGVGYSGGTNVTTTNGSGGIGGEAICGNVGVAAGKGGDYNARNGGNGLCGGGGGSGVDDASLGTAGTGSTTAGGAGGGGGGAEDGTSGGVGYGGGGGGGGYGGVGKFGVGGNSGASGTTNASGNGGAGISFSATVAQGGGGGGGGTYGDAYLNQMFFGAGGGAGGDGESGGTTWYDGGDGGAGGGIVFLAANNIDINGSIDNYGIGGSVGDNSTYSGGGGGGAGGSVYVMGHNVDLGTNKISVSGGTGADSGYDGGSGGDGRIFIKYVSPIIGSTTPSYTSQALAFRSHSIFIGEEINTPEATALGNIAWTEDLDTYGEIQVQTRTGATNDSTDGTWEEWRPATPSATTDFSDEEWVTNLPTWTAKDSDRNWWTVAMSADGTKQSAIVENGQIYISADSGNTWTAKESNRNWGGIAMSADGTKQTAVAYSGQIYVSADSGNTWTAKDSNRGWINVAMSADGTKQTAVVYAGQIYVSTDSGNTWTAKDSNRNWLSVAMSTDGTKQTAVPYGGGQIYVSTDSGNTWTAKDSSRAWYSVAMSADGTKQTAVVENGQIYVSADSGNTWTAKDSNRKWHGVTMSADGTKQIAVVYGGQIYISADSGNTWTAQDSSRNWQGVAISADGSKQTATVYGGKIYTSNNVFADSINTNNPSRNVDYYEDEDANSSTEELLQVSSNESLNYIETKFSTVDLSEDDYLTAWVYATQSGTIASFSMGEAAGNEQEEGIVIDQANTWQKIYWDLSDIASSARDGIQYMRVSLLATNTTLYIDDIKAGSYLSDNTGSAISSTPNEYIQYRFVLSTTNHAYYPTLSDISLGYSNPNGTYTIDANRVRTTDDETAYSSDRLVLTEVNLDDSKSYNTGTTLTSINQTGDYNPGTGADGDIIIDSDTDINVTSKITGRTCVDGGDAVNYSVTNLTDNTATLDGVPSEGCLNVGDEVLLINLQGTTSFFANVGKYETLKVSKIANNLVTFNSTKKYYYGDTEDSDSNIGLIEGTQRVMLQRVPNYHNVTVNTGYNFYPSAWNGIKGGVIFFRATGTVSVSGSIHANAKGYDNNTNGDGGASFCSQDGGGDGADSTYSSTNGSCGGGGGGSASTSLYQAKAYGSVNLGGGGGGGGNGNSTSSGYNQYGGGGGGGGYGTFGYAGAGYYSDATNGSTSQSGDGGEGAPNAGGGNPDHSGGGGGGGTYGSADLAKLYFGSAGGAGGQGWNTSSLYSPGDGGDGGGIVLLQVNNLQVTGTVSSNGGDSAAPTGITAGSSGGGAGGSLKILGSTINIGSSLVSVNGGIAATTTSTYDGGNGGEGRIAIYYADTYSGSTAQTAYTAEVPAYNYSLFISDELATPNATEYNKISWLANLNSYGKVSVETRSGRSNNSTDGTWEEWRSAGSIVPYGEVWTTKETSRFWNDIALSADGTKQIAAVYGKKLFVSTDSGNTWTAKDSDRNWHSVAISADGTKQTAVVYGGQIYVSTDSGNTWTAKDSSRNWGGVAMSADGTIQTAVVGSGQIYVSTDSGNTWTPKDSSRSWMSVSLSADGTKQTAVVYGGQTYISADSGNTWTAKDSNRNWWSVAISADGTKQTAVVDGGQIYVSTDSGNTWTAKESNRTWRFVAMSADGTKQTAVVDGGQIYVSTDSGNTWTAKESNRTWRSIAVSADGTTQAAVVLNDKIYISSAGFTPNKLSIDDFNDQMSWSGANGIYSRNNDYYEDENEITPANSTQFVSDGSRDAWSAGTADTGNGRRLPSAAVYNDKMYVFGGSADGSTALGTMRVYDFLTDSWSAGTADASYVRQNHSAVVYNNKMYVLKGDNGSTYLATVRIYDFATSTWSNGTSDSSAARYSQAILYNGKVYMFGGQNSGGYLDTMRIYDIAGNSWSGGTADTTARLRHSAALYNGKIYYYGGTTDGTNSLDTMRVYDIATDSWSNGPSDSGNYRRGHTAIVNNGKMYVYGGYDNTGNYVSTMSVFDFASNTWSTGTAYASNQRGYNTNVKYNDKMYLFGGWVSSALDSMIVYDFPDSTMEKELDAVVDLSNYDYLTFWVRASAGGNVITAGFGEQAAGENEQAFHIDSSQVWQKIYWDISGIDQSTRDAVKHFRFTVTNLNNAVHFDNLSADNYSSNASGSTINSSPNEYIQYRAILTTSNPAYTPEIFNIQIDWNNGYKVEQLDDNTVRLYNFTGEEQEVRLDAIVFGADLAEWYTVEDESIGPADLVAITGEMDDYGVPILRKTNQANDPMLVGVISTKAGTALGLEASNRRLLALAGRVPVKIDPTSSAIAKGDHLTSSGNLGLARKAKPGELSIGRSFEAWDPASGKSKVMIIVNDAMATPSFGQQLVDGITEIADLLNLKIQDSWEVVNYGTGETVKSAAALAQAIIGKLKVGQMEVSEIKAPEGEKLSLEGSNITIQLNNSEASASAEASGSTSLGKLIIQNQDGETVASFDSDGNASISGQLDVAGISRLGQLIAQEASVSSLLAQNIAVSGQLEAEEIQAESARLDYIESKLANLENASVSGTLYANNIETNSIHANVISGLEERLSSKITETLNQPSLLATLFGEQAQQTDEYLQQLQQELDSITAQNNEASLTAIDQNSNDLTLMADSAFIDQYFEVNGNAFIADSLKLGQSLMVGENTIVGDGFISYQPQLAESEDFTFSIQPTGVGKLSLMAGLMQLDGQGFITINGDLKVAGVLEVEENLKVKNTLLANLIKPNQAGEDIKVQLASLNEEDLSLQESSFAFINEKNISVASFSASGDLALSGSLRLNQDVELASDSGQLVSNRSAGRAILKAGSTEVTIATDQLEENSMIYITPMNSTNNQVLYVKHKVTDSPFTPENEGQFTVAIDYALGHNVNFNWWIIQLN